MKLFYVMPEVRFMVEKALYLYSVCGVNLIDKEYSNYKEMKREINSAFLALASDEDKANFLPMKLTVWHKQQLAAVLRMQSIQKNK